MNKSQLGVLEASSFSSLPGAPKVKSGATSRLASSLWLFATLMIFLGCSSSANMPEQKAPRPVTGIVLQMSKPQSDFKVTGVVSSWKTERIGFEVAGRVKWVLEPGEYVEERIKSDDGGITKSGTVLGELEAEGYRIVRDSAQASLDVAKQNEEAANVNLTNAIPASKASAGADLDLATSELRRMENAAQQNAVSQAELDNARNQFAAADARMKSVLAEEQQAIIQQLSAKANTRAAQERLNSDQRNLDSTQLFGSYRGQISEVHVVPGSMVSAGSPAVTLQMMDPIRVEIEVSAEQSRDMQRRRQVEVDLLGDLGLSTNAPRNAMVYMVDPSADPSTRTFTVTLLMFNEEFATETPGGSTGSVAQTEDIWPVDLNSILGTKDGTFIFEENSVYEDAGGTYVWMAQKARREQMMPGVLEVKKEYVNLSSESIQFLGNWNFIIGNFVNEVSDASKRLITGKLVLPEPADSWDGKSVAYDPGRQWVFRPGDLVNVHLESSPKEAGFFVPIEAVFENAGKTYLFFVQDGRAKRQEVAAVLPDKWDSGTLVRVENLQGSSSSFDGQTIVVGGVHFLKEGDAVNLTKLLPPAQESVMQENSSADNPLQPIENQEPAGDAS